VAEFERCPNRTRQTFQEFCEHRLISFEIWRELKKDRAEASCAFQPFERSKKALQKFFRIFQPFDMREHLMGLDGEAKAIGSICDPVLNGCFFHQLPEGVVDLDGVQLRRVKVQEFLLRELLRIELRLPARVGPSGSADIELSHNPRKSADKSVRPTHERGLYLPARA